MVRCYTSIWDGFILLAIILQRHPTILSLNIVIPNYHPISSNIILLAILTQIFVLSLSKIYCYKTASIFRFQDINLRISRPELNFLRLFQCFDRQIISDCFNFDRILREVHLLSNSGTNGGSSGIEDERRKSGLHISLISQSVFKKVLSKSVVEGSNCDDWLFLWKL